MALRDYMRSVRVENRADVTVLEAVGMTEPAAREMYRLLAIAKVRGSVRYSHHEERGIKI